MNVLVGLFFDLCLLRRGPQDIPASHFLFQVLLMLYFGSNLLLLLVMGEEVGLSVYLALMDMILLVLSIKIIVTLAGFSSRFLQSAIAILGVSTLLCVLVVLVYAVSSNTGDIILALQVWSIVVHGHIFRHALNTRLTVGILVSFVNMVILISILLSL